MSIKVTSEIKIDVPGLVSKTENPTFWKYAASQWHRFMTPFTPMRVGALMEDVTIRPKEIEYNSPYAHYLYKGELMVDAETGSSYARKNTKKVYTDKDLNISTEKHPLASKEWDKAAEPTQKPKLVDAMQKYINSGRLNLDD